MFVWVQFALCLGLIGYAGVKLTHYGDAIADKTTLMGQALGIENPSFDRLLGAVVELLDRFTYEEGENLGLYRLLVDTLSRLDQSPQPAFAVRYYEVRLLDLIGFRPHLFHCASCGESIQPEDQFFSAQEGGVLCPSCGRGRGGVRPIRVAAFEVSPCHRSRFVTRGFYRPQTLSRSTGSASALLRERDPLTTSIWPTIWPFTSSLHSV